MPNKTFTFVTVALLAMAAIGGTWAYDFVLGETEAASGPVTAVPVLETVAPATAESTNASADSAQGSDRVVFQIAQDQSEARFSIYEELAGQPKTVVGTTDQVAGEVAVNLSDLSQIQVGVIQVNARTLVTDSDRRDRAIRNFILETDQYELITFTPTAVTGLSGAAQAGQPFTFQIAGELSIRDITQPVAFDVTVQGESADRLTGTATAVVNRDDFNLAIPSVPNVANVGETVTLEIDFVAEAA